jgi:thiol-disulfide isomerase/thioredoxin
MDVQIKSFQNMKEALRIILPAAVCAIFFAAGGVEVWAQDGSSRPRQAMANIERLGGRVRVQISDSGEEYTEVGLFGGGSFYGWRGGSEGIKYLKGLSNLKQLRIQDVAQFSDAGMAHLKDIKSLETLFVGRSGVSDEGFKYLKGLGRLESLGLWSNGRITDKALEHIKGLKQLKSLRLDDAQITDKGLGKLKKSGVLGRLEFLAVSRTAITDVGLGHLADASGLKVLFLEDTVVGDGGLAHLAHLAKLEALILNNTDVSDAGLAHLKRLSELMVLQLQNTLVSDAGLEHLKGLGKLEQLWLGGTAVTDVGLAYLAGLTSLQSVDLASTKVTDAGLVHLKGLGGLYELSLRQSEVTQAGYMDLRRALWRCQIAWERPGPVRVGKRAPKFGIEQLLQAPKGMAADWKSLEGKVVVLEFWATWCGPCIVSLPHLNDLVEKFKDKPVQFISVTNENRLVVERFLTERQIRGWIGLDTDNSMMADYGVGSIPHVVVVDKTGTVRAITRPAKLSERFLTRLLGEGTETGGTEGQP